MPEPDYDAAIWVESAPDPTGRFAYALTVHYTPDRSVMFSAADAAAYAREVIAVAESAIYAAAVADQLHHVAPMSEWNESVRLRGIVGDACLPVTLSPVLGVTIEPRLVRDRFRPSLHLAIGQEPLTCWSPAAAIRHATQVLAMVKTAAMNQRYLEHLPNWLYLDRDSALAMMSQLDRYRQEAAPGTAASILADMLLAADADGIEDVMSAIMDDPRMSEAGQNALHDLAVAIGPHLAEVLPYMARTDGADRGA